MTRRLSRSLVVLACVACAVACAGRWTPERARAEIDELGVPFDESGFLGAVGSGDNRLVGLFLAAGFDPDRHLDSDPAPIELAAARANLPAIEMMIAAGADANVPGILSVAATRNDVPMLRALLDAGADVESGDPPRITALDAAVRRGNVEATRFLLEHGADPDGRPGRGDRPLIAAVRLNGRELVESLVEHGANVGIVGGTPLTTPLILAAKQGQADLVEYLLARGADPSRVIGGVSAAVAARRAGHREIAAQLERAGDG